MKEATGELNMTVITVVAIAAIAALFYTLVWPAIKDQIGNSTKCASAICESCDSSKKICECTYIKNENGDEGTVKCKNPDYKASK